MGFLTRARERRDTTYQTIWGADLDSPSSPLAGQKVTRDRALGLSAVFACVRLLADTVSTLPVHAYDRRGDVRSQLDPQPDWMLQPMPLDPSVTIVVHFAQVVTSLLLEGNSFTLCTPSVYDPQEVRVLDPRNVEITRQSNGKVVYRVRDFRDQVIDEFDAGRVIHIPLLRLAGELRGISPLEAERQVFSGSLAADELAGRFLRNGTWMSAVIEAPAGVTYTKEQADELIERVERKYSGTRNAGRVGLLTGGAKLTPLTVTPEQAQFLETRQYDDERIFRIYRCPPVLVGMVREGAVSYASAVAQATAFEKHTVRPLVDLIEPSYRPLLGGGARYLRFNTKGLLRGDPKTQSELYHEALNDRWMTKDEIRGLEDMNPIGGEDGGFLSTPNNTMEPAEPSQDRMLVIQQPAPESRVEMPVTLQLPPDASMRTVIDRDADGRATGTHLERVA